MKSNSDSVLLRREGENKVQRFLIPSSKAGPQIHPGVFFLGLFKPRFALTPLDSVLAHPLREAAPQWIQTASVSMDTFSQPANERAAEGAVAVVTGRLEQVVLMNC